MSREAIAVSVSYRYCRPNGSTPSSARAQPFDTKPSNNNNLRVIMTVVGDKVDPRRPIAVFVPTKNLHPTLLK
jgi:hypothetical protein